MKLNMSEFTSKARCKSVQQQLKKSLYGAAVGLVLFATGCATSKIEPQEESPEKAPEAVDEVPAAPEIVHNSLFYENFQELDTGLPLVSIQIEGRKKVEYKAGYYNASLDFIFDGFSDIIDENAFVKARGNTSWVYFPKKPYTLKLSKSQSLFGLPEDKKFAIVSNYPDKSLIRNTYADLLCREVFTKLLWTPVSINVDVLVNGEYRGNYTLAEQIKIGKNRVNIQSMEKAAKGKGKDYNGDGVVDYKDGGFILEVDFRQDDEFCWKTTKGCYFSLKDPKPDDFEEFSSEQKGYIIQLVQAAENAVYSGKNLEKYLDLPSFADWCLVNDFLRNTDSFSWVSSAFLYFNPEDQKFYMGPVWDFDIAMGNYYQKEYGDLYSPDKWCDRRRWIGALYQSRDFVNLLKKRWHEISSSVYESINTQVQPLADKNDQSAQLNFNKWPVLGAYVWPNVPGWKERKTYQSEVDYLITWLNDRFTWFDANIDKL